MRINRFDVFHLKARRNNWLRYFAVFNRIVLAAGFLPSGMQKIIGERFTSLAVQHPMGNYLEAVYHTGYYYTFIGCMQVLSAVLLLIPRTVTLGALLYFPIIVNICILSYSVRFDGSLFTAPLMVLACLFLLLWDYHKLKWIFPFFHTKVNKSLSHRRHRTNAFPTSFFMGVVACVLGVLLINNYGYEIKPKNTLKDCKNQCQSMEVPAPCYVFCDCIHAKGKPFNACLETFEKSEELVVQYP